jgi:hypothetical protein
MCTFSISVPTKIIFINWVKLKPGLGSKLSPNIGSNLSPREVDPNLDQTTLA